MQTRGEIAAKALGHLPADDAETKRGWMQATGKSGDAYDISLALSVSKTAPKEWWGSPGSKWTKAILKKHGLQSPRRVVNV